MSYQSLGSPSLDQHLVDAGTLPRDSMLCILQKRQASRPRKMPFDGADATARLVAKPFLADDDEIGSSEPISEGRTRPGMNDFPKRVDGGDFRERR